MTIAQFLDHLDAGEWSLDADGNLIDRNDYCPIWHVYHRFFDDEDEDEAIDYGVAGNRIGLRTRDAISIAQAADNRGRPRLRKRLLLAVGLDENKSIADPV